MMAELSGGIRFIKGIGEQRAKLLARLGICTLRDLISYFPRDYQDRTIIKKVPDVKDGESVCISALVLNAPRASRIRKGMELLKFRAADDTGAVNITYFNSTYLKDKFKVGEEYVFFGKFTRKPGGVPELINPEFEPAESAAAGTRRIVPVYRLTAGISGKVLYSAILQGLDSVGDPFPEVLPESVRTECGLAHAAYAYRQIHAPSDAVELAIARRRLVFEELFVLSCAFGSMKKRHRESTGSVMKSADPAGFYKSLPFELTNAQKRAAERMMKDMSSGHAMNRLLQGDVGSGKTAVAAQCIWYAHLSGYQSAFMAPTEILAEQHYKTFSSLLAPFGIKVVLLTGSLGAKAKREALQMLESGEADLAVGTHAIISEGVRFKNLALAVTDEQHRFGVRQRASLSEKGDRPHVLVMSATPIPRTLALIIYGDMDVSILDELPPGRRKVETYAVDESMRPRIERFTRKLVGQGRQVFIVCPMIEESEEDSGTAAAVEYAERLRQDIFPDLSVALLHGKMKAADKERIMTSFSMGEINILVSTTVVEVGVDVPNAALMIVENAERFGLSQLHQLRGRVGRGSHQSYCVLMCGTGDAEANARLKVMCSTNDGFKIAEEDLKLRGPGDFFGDRQHGLPEMRLADLSCDMDTLSLAQEQAEKLLISDPTLIKPEHALLRERVDELSETALN